MSFSEFAGHRKYNLIEFQGKPLIENSKEFELNQNSLKWFFLPASFISFFCFARYRTYLLLKGETKKESNNKKSEVLVNENWGRKTETN